MERFHYWINQIFIVFHHASRSSHLGLETKQQLIYMLIIIIILIILIIMARRAIPMIAFPRVRTIYIYIFSCVHLREYALYM